MKDLRDLVGDDLDPREAERLGRVHELLTRAGPPPELPPELAAPTGAAPPARVIPFPRRYRFTLTAAAAVAATALFGIGYLVGAIGEAPVRTVSMTGETGARATLELFEEDAAGNWPMELEVRDLPPGTYELWLTKDGELAEPCGVFKVSDPTTTVPLNAPYRLRRFDGWVVVRAGKTTPVLTT